MDSHGPSMLPKQNFCGAALLWVGGTVASPSAEVLLILWSTEGKELFQVFFLGNLWTRITEVEGFLEIT